MKIHKTIKLNKMQNGEKCLLSLGSESKQIGAWGLIKETKSG